MSDVVLLQTRRFGGNVAQYFERCFPTHLCSDFVRANNLMLVSIDSSCGDDCKRAIDAGAALVERVRMAHGDFPKGNEFAQMIGDIVVDICSVYITG